MCVCMYVCVCVCICIYICVCVCVILVEAFKIHIGIAPFIMRWNAIFGNITHTPWFTHTHTNTYIHILLIKVLIFIKFSLNIFHWIFSSFYPHFIKWWRTPPPLIPSAIFNVGPKWYQHLHISLLIQICIILLIIMSRVFLTATFN